MTDPNRHADPDDGVELVSYSLAHELSARSRRGRSAMRTATVAVVSFGMGAFAATAVLAVRENAPQPPVLASGSPAPDPLETAAMPLQVPQPADVASDSALEPEPVSLQRLRPVAVEPDDAPPSRPLRDVTVEPNVDPSALSQDRGRVAEGVVRPTLDAGPTDEQARPEPWATDRQEASVTARDDAPAEEIPTSAPADPLVAAAPELAATSGESDALPASARVTSAVSMRSGPDRKTEVVGVVPAAGPVQIVSCDGWCEVVYNGQRGFIYETFLDSAP